MCGRRAGARPVRGLLGVWGGRTPGRVQFWSPDSRYSMPATMACLRKPGRYSAQAPRHASGPFPTVAVTRPQGPPHEACMLPLTPYPPRPLAHPRVACPSLAMI